jgi:hypothetical protein
MNHEGSRTLHSVWARRAPLLLLVVLLVGPAPGEVGSCGQAEEQLDAQQFCLDKAAYLCARIDARGDFPTDIYPDLEACRQTALESCSSASWRPDCRPFPTKPEGQACIDELSRASNLRLPVSEIPECQLCP